MVETNDIVFLITLTALTLILNTKFTVLLVVLTTLNTTTDIILTLIIALVFTALLETILELATAILFSDVVSGNSLRKRIRL